MKVWHIWDFPESVYIYLREGFREEFFNNMFSKCGGKRPYAKFLCLSQMTIKIYHRGYTFKNGIKHLQAVPLVVFKKSLALMSENLKNRFEKNIIAIKLKNKGLSINNVKLPFRESPAFYRVVAHILCDGSMSDKGGVYYANNRKELRDEFKMDLGIFGDMKIYEIKPQTTPIVYFPKVLGRTLAHLLKIRFAYPDHLPKDILNAPDECKTAFLRAVFDDEGTISTNLAIGMANRNVVEEIKELLESLNIKATSISVKRSDKYGDNYQFNVRTKCFSRFNELIGFTSLDKAKKLGSAISTRRRIVRTNPKEIIEGRIINMLKDKNAGTLEIANNVELTLGYLNKFLKSMELDDKIVRSGFKNNLKWSLPKV